MKFRGLFPAVFLALPLMHPPAARAQSLCDRLSAGDVEAAVGVPLERSPSNPCRFGHGVESFTILIHRGDGPNFSDYADNARREFKDVRQVRGIGSDAIFFGFNLAVKTHGDVIFVQMLMGHSPAEKLQLAKAVVEKLLAYD